jgi:hypothetical protein
MFKRLENTKEYLIAVALLMVCIICFGCENFKGNNLFTANYNSKTYLTQTKFLVGVIRYEEELDNKYKLKNNFVEDSNKMIITSEYYRFDDKVKDYKSNKYLFNKKQAYILTNEDSYFAIGADENDYYYIKELTGYIVYSDLQTGNGYQKEFTVPPYLNNVRYIMQNLDSQQLQISIGERVNIPYDWEYLKNFYSQLNYAEINEGTKTITINCYTVTTNMQLNLGIESIDTIDIVFSSQDDANSIKFVV